VDGGGTRTRARLTDASGQVLGEGEAGASALAQGAAQAWRHVIASVEAAAAQVPGFELAGCALGLGLSGTGRAGPLAEFVASCPAVAAAALTSDGLAAVLGAHGGQPGGILVAGTGSVAEAIDAVGQRHQTGGWGWQLGDDGGGAWLGREALRHGHAALDGRTPAGPLAAAVLATCGHTRDTLLAWSLAAGQAELASLAPLVFAHAAQDERHDKVAEHLLAAAARALDDLARALPPVPLALGGSIAEQLQARLAPATRARLVPPQGDAMDGALFLARLALTA
jgi:glucosamine kinase